MSSSANRTNKLIEDVIRAILEHLGRWAPRKVAQRERAPPEAEQGRTSKQTTDVLTYHVVPDIAWTGETRKCSGITDSIGATLPKKTGLR